MGTLSDLKLDRESRADIRRLKELLRDDQNHRIARIRGFLKMGVLLIRLKSRIPHGSFLPALKLAAIGISKAERLMIVAKRFGHLADDCEPGLLDQLPADLHKLVHLAASGEGDEELSELFRWVEPDGVSRKEFAALFPSQRRKGLTARERKARRKGMIAEFHRRGDVQPILMAAEREAKRLRRRLARIASDIAFEAACSLSLEDILGILACETARALVQRVPDKRVIEGMNHDVLQETSSAADASCRK